METTTGAIAIKTDISYILQFLQLHFDHKKSQEFPFSNSKFLSIIQSDISNLLGNIGNIDFFQFISEQYIKNLKNNLVVF